MARFFYLSTRFFPKKPFESILNLHTVVTSCKRIREVPCIKFSLTLSNLIWDPFWEKQKRTSSQKIHWVNFKFLYYMWKKYIYIKCIIFLYNFKNLTFGPSLCCKRERFWAKMFHNICPILAQKLQNKISQKKDLGQF